MEVLGVPFSIVLFHLLLLLWSHLLCIYRALVYKVVNPSVSLMWLSLQINIQQSD